MTKDPGDAEWVLPDGIDADERADILAALVEAHGLHDLRTGRLEIGQTATRLITVVCDEPGHERARHSGGPELAFVYATTRGLLLETTLHGRHDDEAARSSRPQRDGFEPVEVLASLCLLERTRPATEVVQCREHGAQVIRTQELLDLARAAQADPAARRVQVPLRLLLD